MRIFLMLLAPVLAVTVHAASLPDVIDRVRPSVVGVGTMYPARQPNRKRDPLTYLATGFVVGNGTLVVTNAHVVTRELDAAHHEALVIFSGRGENALAHPVRILRTDMEHDLAVLEFDGDPLPALQLGDSDAVREGQEVAFTGFPIGVVLGLYPVTHRGIVSSITPMARPVEQAGSLDAAQLRRLRNPFNAFQLDAIAYPGNSGSPVYDPASGRVLGILNSVFVKEGKESLLSKPSGISYAIPVNHIKPLLTPAN